MTVTDVTALTRVRALARTGAARDIRVRAGLSTGEIAAAVGVAVATVWRWEHGHRVPRGEAAVRYGQLLDSLIAGGRQ